MVRKENDLLENLRDFLTEIFVQLITNFDQRLHVVQVRIYPGKYKNQMEVLKHVRLGFLMTMIEEDVRVEFCLMENKFSNDNMTLELDWKKKMK